MSFAGAAQRSPLTITDHFGKNLIDVSTMTDIVDFDNARAFIDAVYDPVTLEKKLGTRPCFYAFNLKTQGEFEGRV
jgi:hypothetical protein